MLLMKNLVFFFLLIFSFSISIAQNQTTGNVINPDVFSKRWDAVWITHPTASLTSHGVYYFRKVFELPSVPQQFIIHISADNRYELYVNGKRILLGPSWGDLHHWRFESIDIAPYLVFMISIASYQGASRSVFSVLPAVYSYSSKPGSRPFNTVVINDVKQYHHITIEGWRVRDS